MKNNDLYLEILEKIYEHMVGGVATPLGAGPSGNVEYAPETATDKKYRKRKKRNRSIQKVLKSN